MFFEGMFAILLNPFINEKIEYLKTSGTVGSIVVLQYVVDKIPVLFGISNLLKRAQ